MSHIKDCVWLLHHQYIYNIWYIYTSSNGYIYKGASAGIISFFSPPHQHRKRKQKKKETQQASLEKGTTSLRALESCGSRASCFRRREASASRLRDRLERMGYYYGGGWSSFVVREKRRATAEWKILLLTRDMDNVLETIFHAASGSSRQCNFASYTRVVCCISYYEVCV